MPENLYYFLSSSLHPSDLVPTDAFVSISEGTGWQQAALADGRTVSVYCVTSADLVKRVRKLQSSIRTLNRNVRLHRYEGRNRGGDTTYLQAQVDVLLPTLPRRLQGLLTHEHKLAERISENRDAGHARPELRARMTGLRSEIKEAVNA